MGDATNLVTGLVEAEHPTTAELLDAHRRVAAVAERYRELLEGVPDEERDQVERSYGRRVTDLRRLAGLLPQLASGQDTERAADRGFILRRPPPRSIEPSFFEAARRRDQDTYHVGREVEAWCGPCGGLTAHTIAALVGGQPKQVICATCGARHGYRRSPARKSAPKSKTPQRLTPEQIEARRSEEARFALMRELAEATEVRRFAAGEHYKAGEILEHPTHGRGKIETVMRGAIVVRFRDGVRSFTLL